jgi:hypothetical protein
MSCTELFSNRGLHNRFEKLGLANGVDAVATHIRLGQTLRLQMRYPAAETELLSG